MLDDEKLTLVIGGQDYDDFLGPMVYVYAENKSDRFLGLSADSAEADGVFCDYILYGETLAPGKVKIEATWPESAAVLDTWEMTATLTEDGKLVYENGVFVSTEYGEGGEGWEIDSDWCVTGELTLDNGELIWQDSRAENGTFIHA